MALPDARRESLIAHFLTQALGIQTRLGQVVMGVLFASAAVALAWTRAGTSDILLASVLVTSISQLWRYANSNAENPHSRIGLESGALLMLSSVVWSVVWLIVTPLLCIAQIVIRGAFWFVSAL